MSKRTRDDDGLGHRDRDRDRDVNKRSRQDNYGLSRDRRRDDLADRQQPHESSRDSSQSKSYGNNDQPLQNEQPIKRKDRGDQPWTRRREERSQERQRPPHRGRENDSERYYDQRSERHDKNDHRPRDRQDGRTQEEHGFEYDSYKYDPRSEDIPSMFTGEALWELPRSTSSLCAIPPYVPRAAVSGPLPLPPVNDETLATLVFQHRSYKSEELSYERLEFLGDAYIEVFASRLLFHSFGQHTSIHALAQCREALVCNDTLSNYAKHYGFDERLRSGSFTKGSKGMNKILGDCFEAYVAALVLDSDNGFDVAEKWCASLWECMIAQNPALRPNDAQLKVNSGSDIRHIYDAKNLDMLGEAHVELFATRLIYARYSHLHAGRMSQLRELLFNLNTTAHLARAMGLDGVSALDSHRWRGRKAHERAVSHLLKKQVAIDILLGGIEEYAKVEKDFVRLWALFLADRARNDNSWLPEGASEPSNDPRKIYNPVAKDTLQKRIVAKGAKLQYEPYQQNEELKGKQLGFSKHFIAVYYTGYGYDGKLLGKGEGKSKAEAGNWAAIEAMYGDGRAVVEECEKKAAADKAANKKMREEADLRKAEMEKGGDGQTEAAVRGNGIGE